MASTLIVKLISAASGFSRLTALLGSSPFRMYSLQLIQASAFPAVTVQVISNQRSYSVNARLATSFTRVQFNIFGATPGGENARAVEAALVAFLDQFNGDGITGRSISPNQVMNSREWAIAATQPETFQILLDAMIFENELV